MKLAHEVFRDDVTEGLPESGRWQPPKVDVRELIGRMDLQCFNPCAFGATGSGDDDDTDAINAASAAANAAGRGAVVFPGGLTFKTTAALNGYSKTLMIGAGQGATRILCANGDINHIGGNNLDRFMVQGLTIEVTGIGTTSQVGAVHIATSSHCVVSDVEIIGVSWVGVLIRGQSTKNLVTGVYCHDFLGSVQDSSDVMIYSSIGTPLQNCVAYNQLHGGNWHGVCVQDPNGSFQPQHDTIAYNVVGQHKAYGLLCYMTANNDCFTRFIGNTVSDILGSVLSGNAGHGIYAVGAGGVSIIDNDIENVCTSTTGSSLGAAGIAVNILPSTLHPAQILNNKIRKVQRFGGITVIGVAAGADISGNQIVMPDSNTDGAGAINVQNSSNIGIVNNRCHIPTSGSIAQSGISVIADGQDIDSIEVLNNRVLGGGAKSIILTRTGSNTITDALIHGNRCKGGNTSNFPLALVGIVRGSVMGNLLNGTNPTAVLVHTNSTGIRYAANVIHAGGTGSPVGALITGTNTGSYWDLSNFNDGVFTNSGSGMTVET